MGLDFLTTKTKGGILPHIELDGYCGGLLFPEDDD
jgi:hypothetical protein